METFAESINTILKFFMGENGWRLWIAGCPVLWIIWKIEGISWYLYGAIFCSIMVILLGISWINICQKKQKQKKEAIAEKELLQEQEAQRQEAEKFEYKNYIWKFFATVDKEKLDEAACLLDFEIIPNNEYSRFIPRKVLTDKVSSAIWDTVNYMQIFNNGYDATRFIEEDKRFRDGVYLRFEPYFLSLLKHYKETGKREFL